MCLGDRETGQMDEVREGIGFAEIIGPARDFFPGEWQTVLSKPRSFFARRRVYVRAAGFFEAASRIVFRMLFGTCSNVNGSIEYEARPLDSERIAVA